MKKIYFLIIVFAAGIMTAYAQNDTIFFEDFEDSVYVTQGISPGITGDTTWFNYNADANTDASGLNRPEEWFLNSGFATDDQGTTVLVSNSWTNPATAVHNYLITGSIYVSDTSFKLSWKSAPYQTPYYVDGYSVRISTTTNDPFSFNDTLFTAAEYVSKQSSLPDTSFSRFTFSPGFVHGQDGQYIEYANDSLRFFGVLRPFTVSLSNYVGKNVYIAFEHNATDDNLISIDDILVTKKTTTGISTHNKGMQEWSIYPNPAKDKANIAYSLTNSSNVKIIIYDLSGKVIITEDRGYQLKGNHNASINTQNLAAGEYNLVLETVYGKKAKKLVVTK